jgi:glycine hydroxymethyltransferase
MDAVRAQVSSLPNRAPLSQQDPLIFQALQNERRRQNGQIELIASENTVSPAVLEALGSVMTNKSVEGYPGKRYHGGADFADVVEQAAIDRAKQLFGCAYANVQPHSGTQANQAVFLALLKPGDRVLSMSLAAGGHLSHGAAPSYSGKWFEAQGYGVARETGRLDYDAIEQQAQEFRPKLLIAGGSAYPRVIDFQRLRAIADGVGASFLVDMAHIAGLVAAGEHPSPLPIADVVTGTTTKTLRGPRGGLLLWNREDLARKLQAGVFPGVQGSVHLPIVAAKAVALGEALQPAFRDYIRRVVANARALAKTLQARGLGVISGGTDTHLVLIDVSTKGLKGQSAQDLLCGANLTCNKNPVPFDSMNPAEWVGVRLGSPSGTTRGFDEATFAEIGHMIADLLEDAGRNPAVKARVLRRVEELCRTTAPYPG